MGDHPLKELNARVPDGVMDSKKDKKSANLKKGVAGMQDVPAGTHCHHGQDVHCEAHCDGNHPHNALKLRASDEEYDSFTRFRLGGLWRNALFFQRVWLGALSYAIRKRSRKPCDYLHSSLRLSIGL